MFGCLLLTSYLGLFIQFYIQTYKKPAGKKAVANGKANGVANGHGCVSGPSACQGRLLMTGHGQTQNGVILLGSRAEVKARRHAWVWRCRTVDTLKVQRHRGEHVWSGPSSVVHAIYGSVCLFVQWARTLHERRRLMIRSEPSRGRTVLFRAGGFPAALVVWWRRCAGP